MSEQTQTRARLLKFGTIRARLMISFIVLALFPVAVVGLVTGPVTAANNRLRVLNQLGAIAALKEEQINTWMNQLLLDAGDQVDQDQSLSLFGTLLKGESTSKEFAEAGNLLHARFERSLDRRRNFESLSVVTPQGNVVLTTDPRQATRDYSQEPALPTGLAQPYIAPPAFDRQSNQFFLDAYTPIVDTTGNSIGVLVGRANMGQLGNIMSERTGLGQTGETYLVGANGAALTEPLYGTTLGLAPSLAVEQALASQRGGSDTYTSYHGAPVFGAWRWLSRLQSVLVAEQESTEVLEITNLATSIPIAVMLITVAVAVAAALLVTRSVAGPIEHLEQTANEVAAGHLEKRAVIERADEIGSLAQAFNSMTAQLQSFIGTLEERVQARTEQLQASADVGRTAVSVLQTDQLLSDIVNLIAERFGFYYVAIFTLDKTGQYAVLREATGEAGRILKEQQHKLEVGGQSMVGFVTSRRQARIALDVGEDAVRFANPLLPQTRSEIALPLLVGDMVLGALDAQSTVEAAFDDTSAVVLQSMADQVSIALNNAQSFAESQAIVRRSRALFAVSRQVNEVRSDLKSLVDEMLRTASEGLGIERWWVVIFDAEHANLVPLSTNAWLGADSALNLVEQANNLLVRSAVQREQFIVNDAMTDARLQTMTAEQRAGMGKFVVIPIVERDTVSGVLAYGRSSAGGDLNQSDLEVANVLGDLLAIVLENHRLFQTAQQAQLELDSLNRYLTGESWSTFTRKRKQSGVLWFSTGQDYAALPEIGEALAGGHIATHLLDNDEQIGVAVPIVLRDIPLGAFRLVIPRQRWDDELLATLESIAGHVAQAAENVRLLSVTEERFARERALSEATDKVRRRSEIEAILETAAAELARYLNASHVAVRLKSEASQFNGGQGE